MFGLGIQEILIVGAVAVMLFGKRLPEVARSLGGSYRDFRRGLTEIQSQMNINDTLLRFPLTIDIVQLQLHRRGAGRIRPADRTSLRVATAARVVFRTRQRIR